MKYKGLTDEQVIQNRQSFGSNELTPPPRHPWWQLLLSKFNDPIIKLLLFTACLALGIGFVEGSYIEGVGILAAVLLATLLAFFNEFQAEKEFDILNKVNDETPVKVMRHGQVTKVPKRELVVGDIVLLDQGDEVPADGHLLEAFSLHVNESALNGESMPAAKVVKAPEHYETAYAPNVVLRGTIVTDGQGLMEVSAVGDASEIGKTAREAAAINTEQTPLNKQLTRLSGVIGKLGFAVAISIFILLVVRSWFTGEVDFPLDLREGSVLLTYFMVTVTIIVAAVPEGLAMSVTLSLAYSMRRMTCTNNLVRRMHATETMGATTVICTDKTGTLTQNEMRVHANHFDDSVKNNDVLMAESIALNSTAHLDRSNPISANPVGNPTEGALLLWIDELQVDYEKIREEGKIADRLLFTTENKFMATRCISPSLCKDILYVKGAPEVIMKRCKAVPEEVSAMLKDYQQRGMRTLAFAWKEMKATDSGALLDLSNELCYLGFVAIADPVRIDVKEAINNCMEAGIEVKIITGDTAATATEIARQIDLWLPSDSADQQITGIEFAALSETEAKLAALRIKIMSRARPADKLRLVRLLQQQGAVVAVTGDGINDAPALNFADVGLSMGSGTSVAKEASDIVLLDDSFTSIVNAVRWGRSLYRNIQRFIQFQLTINVLALMVAFLGPFIGVTLPFTAIQMLWVNLIMDTFAALALATEPPDNSVMHHKPRKASDFIITPFMAKNIFITAGIMLCLLLAGMLFYVPTNAGYPSVELTVFFTVFVMLQFWNLFNVRCSGTNCSAFCGLLKNKAFLLIVAAILLMQLLIVQFGGTAFRTVPLSPIIWGCIIAGTSVVLWAGEIIRAVQRIKETRVINK
ncbi:MAG: calcium-translocating P-type ATPase, PMCA-type [Bacteroidales bacterium]|nr:calcium-translocating P-type ATPase, PMCA-type [Bacteroidales bacterium]MCL2133765.1 calcium-translocating P-type ATPase, PMCA-type [Bacteroidales bacterium]